MMLFIDSSKSIILT